MERNLNNKISEINKVQFANRWWYKFVVCLSAFAVFFVTYFLMLPAMTDSVTTYGTEVITTEGMNSNNIYPIDAILGPEAGYTVDSTQTPGQYTEKTGAIVTNTEKVRTILIKTNPCQNLRSYFYGKGNADTSVDGTVSAFGINLDDWIGMKFSYSEEYERYYLAHIKTTCNDVSYMTTGDVEGDKGFILLVRKSFVGSGMYLPDECDGTKDGKFQCVIKTDSNNNRYETYTYNQAANDIYAHINTAPIEHYATYTDDAKVTDYLAIAGCRPSYGDVTANNYPGFGLITISPYIDLNNVANAVPLAGDIDNSGTEHITFKLFDYSKDINKRFSDVSFLDDSAWEKYVPAINYFSFRNDYFLDVEFYNYWGHHAVCTCGGTSHGTCLRKYKSYFHRNEDSDADGFTIKHTTTQFVLNSDGFPMLDPLHDATGAYDPTDSVKAAYEADHTWIENDRWNLGYLFSGKIAEKRVADLTLAPGAVTAYDPINNILQYDPVTSTYWYDSATNAVDYNTEENKFYLRGYTEKNDDTATIEYDMTGYADFLPFNYGKGIVTETYSVYKDGFQSIHRDSTFNRYNLDSRTYTDVNYWFGMTMEFSFIQSKDGTVKYYKDGVEYDEDMIFSFSGDDDVWVFIDNVKVLELGGTHGEVVGSINFKTGEIEQYLNWGGHTKEDTVEKVGKDKATSFPTTLKECFTRANKVDSVAWDSSGETFEDYSIHTLKFFYMERGAAVANCSIKFNLPSFSDKALIVEKNLQHASDDTDELSDEVLEYLRDTKDFEFRVLQANKTDLLFVEGDKFQIFNKETGKTTDATVGPGGIFTLKHNEQAIFGNLWEKTGSTEDGIISYYVQELIPNSQTGQYDSVMYSYDINANKTTVTGANCGVTGFKGYTSPALQPIETHTVVFTNTVSVDDLYELTIEKTLETIPGAPSLSSEDFNVKVTLDGTLLPVGTVYQVKTTTETTTRTVTEEGIVTITPDETVVIKGILAGTTYVVEEQFDLLENGYIIKYDGVISSEGTTGSISGDKTIVITNSQSGANISILISKTLQNALSTSNYSFDFSLIQVKKNSSGTFVDSSTVLASKTLTCVGTQGDSDLFSLQYLSADFATGDTYLYYKIVESTSNKVSLITYDNSAYVVTVKINKATNGVLTATIGGITKYSDGNITSDGTSATSVAFVNTLNLYSLPATGGDGQTYEASLFKVGGILIICAIAGLMLCISACKRRQINM